MSNIPVHRILREIKHPAWIPVNVDGTAPAVLGTATAPVLGDFQPVGIGAADYVIGMSPNTLTYMGDAGQMLTLNGYNTAFTQEDHTGDGDSVIQMRDIDLETPGVRQLSCVAPSGFTWVPAFLHTVARDAMKRPMVIKDTYATGKSVEQSFNIAALSHPIEAKGVLKIEADLTPHGGATETGLS